MLPLILVGFPFGFVEPVLQLQGPRFGRARNQWLAEAETTRLLPRQLWSVPLWVGHFLGLRNSRWPYLPRTETPESKKSCEEVFPLGLHVRPPFGGHARHSFLKGQSCLGYPPVLVAGFNRKAASLIHVFYEAKDERKVRGTLMWQEILVYRSLFGTVSKEGGLSKVAFISFGCPLSQAHPSLYYMQPTHRYMCIYIYISHIYIYIYIIICIYTHNIYIYIYTYIYIYIHMTHTHTQS